MIDFFVQNFSGYIWLAVIIISMIPSFENRVAIPFAMSVNLLGAQALSPFMSLLCAFLGSIIPAVPIILFCKFIKRKSSSFLKKINTFSPKIMTNLKKVESKDNSLLKMFFLAAFVAIPLPMTGVWTGSFIAGLSDLSFFKGFIAISIGAFFSSLLVLVVSLMFADSIIYLLIGSLILAFVVFLFQIIKRKKR